MLKKIVPILVAALLTVAMSAPALADPTDSPAPTATPTAKSTLSPEASGILAEVKQMRTELAALRGKLTEERELDKQIHDQILAIKGIVQLDKAKVQEYQSQLKTLADQRKDLAAQLKAAQAAKPKDQAKIDSLKAQIADIDKQIADLKAKNQPLVDAIHGNALGRRTLQPLRDMLKPYEDQLKPLIATAKTLNATLNSQSAQLRKVLKANDTATGETLLGQITDTIGQLKANVSSRIAIRVQMTQVLSDYKASLQTVTP